jgi:hypothetical protein
MRQPEKGWRIVFEARAAAGLLKACLKKRK